VDKENVHTQWNTLQTIQGSQTLNQRAELYKMIVETRQKIFEWLKWKAFRPE
jgi:hypothetical protein